MMIIIVLVAIGESELGRQSDRHQSKKKKKGFILRAILLILTGCSTIPKNNPSGSEPAYSDKTRPSIAEVLLDHRFFLVNYNKDHRLANWVRYTIEKKDLGGNGVRIKKFRYDPLLKAMGIEPVQHNDYANSGYDRGHLAPAEDFSRSQEAIESTFVMSNVIPQTSRVNSGAWRSLEKQVRSYACGEEKITVITGPILKAGLPTLKAKISIPQEFFKIVIDETPPKKSLAFIFNQNERGQSVSKNQVTINVILSMVPLQRETIPEDSKLTEWKTCQ